MSLEDTMLSGIRQSQKENTARFHPDEAFQVIKLIETENKIMVARGWGKEKWRVVRWVPSFSFVR